MKLYSFHVADVPEEIHPATNDVAAMAKHLWPFRGQDFPVFVRERLPTKPILH